MVTVKVDEQDYYKDAEYSSYGKIVKVTPVLCLWICVAN